MRFVKKVNERGVVTLPAEVREALGVDEGDIVEFDVLGVVKKKGQETPTRFTAAVASDDETPTRDHA